MRIRDHRIGKENGGLCPGAFRMGGKACCILLSRKNVTILERSKRSQTAQLNPQFLIKGIRDGACQRKFRSRRFPMAERYACKASPRGRMRRIIKARS